MRVKNSARTKPNLREVDVVYEDVKRLSNEYGAEVLKELVEGGQPEDTEIEWKAKKFDELIMRSHRNSTPERVRESLGLLCDKKTRDALKVLRENRRQPTRETRRGAT